MTPTREPHVFPERVTLAWPVRAQLGEGPVWIGRERALWFVDIEGRALHRFDPASGERRTLPMPARPSFVVPAADGGLLFGMELDLWRWRGGAIDRVAPVPGPRGCRTNDGTVDPHGRLWFGTMDDEKSAPIGQLHRFDGRTVHPVGGACRITNGPAVSPDGGTLYHVDTLGGLVWAFDVSSRDHLEDGRVFVRIDPADGTPDGVVVDAEGAVWVALWGGWGVRRYAPDGRLLATVAVPAAQVTKIAFGGDDLRTVFVTTANIGLSAEDLASQPEAGSLFTFDSPVPGLPTPEVAVD